MQKMTALVVFLFICFNSNGYGEKPAPLVVEIPVPIHSDWILPEDTVRIAPATVAYDIEFYISRDGCVDSLVYLSEHRDYLIKPILPSLYSLDFEPARYADDSIPFVLPGVLLYV